MSQFGYPGFIAPDDDPEDDCRHSWVCEDVESGEGRSYCEFCGADGDG